MTYSALWTKYQQIVSPHCKGNHGRYRRSRSRQALSSKTVVRKVVDRPTVSGDESYFGERFSLCCSSSLRVTHNFQQAITEARSLSNLFGVSQFFFRLTYNLNLNNLNYVH